MVGGIRPSRRNPRAPLDFLAAWLKNQHTAKEELADSLARRERQVTNTLLSIDPTQPTLPANRPSMLKNHHTLSPASRTRFVPALALVLAAAGACRPPEHVRDPAQRTLAITNVHVVDVRAGRIDSNRTVLIDGNTITAIVPAGREPPRVTRVDGLAGAFVIPGLWDMHVHVARSGRSTLGLYVANGVTGVRDMGGEFGLVRAWADSVSAGTLLGPEILVASPMVERASWLTAVKKYAVENRDTSLARDLETRIPIATPEDAIRAVDSIVAMRADFLKIRNDAAPATTFALLRRARERGLRVAGHWPAALTPTTAADSGYASLEHGPLTVVNRALAPTLDQIPAEQRRAVFATLARTRTAYTPTLVALKGFRLTPESVIARTLADSAGTLDYRMRFVPSDLLARWRAAFSLLAFETSKDDWASFNRSFLRDILPMADAGVILLAGTDVGSALVQPAFSLADELQALVTDAGLTPLQSLRTATLNVGAWLGKSATIGVVSPGARADLVFLAANPLDDIGNVRRIRAVLRRGRLLNRTMLDELLTQARQR